MDREIDCTYSLRMYDIIKKLGYRKMNELQHGSTDLQLHFIEIYFHIYEYRVFRIQITVCIKNENRNGDSIIIFFKLSFTNDSQKSISYFYNFFMRIQLFFIFLSLHNDV